MFFRKINGWLLLSSALVLLASCSAEEKNESPETSILGNLPLGEMPEVKADNAWGNALKCKAIPALTPLRDPQITLSLNGLSLHLVDRATGFSKVYPIGVGKINTKEKELTYNESLSYYPVLSRGNHNFSIDTSKVDPCKIWWTDPDSGEKSPVFAGLPFLSWYGDYGIHGPIDNYWEPQGGKLRRGYVSHGCIRMEAANIAEVWAYIKGVRTVPVRVQKEIERNSQGVAFDVADKWLLSECDSDADCPLVNYENGKPVKVNGAFCKKPNPYGKGFCTTSCDKLCTDRSGYPVSFCVGDKAQPNKGYCTLKASDFNYDCHRFAGLSEALGQPRFQDPSSHADVCLPGTDGWLGSICYESTECLPKFDSAGNNSRFCHRPLPNKPGFCTEKCSQEKPLCPDLAGYPGTFCVEGLCRSKCDPSANSGCYLGFSCQPEPRFGQPQVKDNVCMLNAA